jgi:hypothetical protein
MPTPNAVSSSMPAQSNNLDSYQRYVGVVLSSLPVKDSVYNGSTNVEVDVLSVSIKVIAKESVKINSNSKLTPIKPEDDKISSYVNEEAASLPVAKDEVAHFFFPINSAIRQGEKIEVTTRRKSQVSQGWTSDQYAASFRKID